MSRPTEPATGSAIELSILVIEDDETIRATTEFLLTDAGHRVMAASDGAKALGLIRENAFDVVICDVRLPKIDGMTLFRLLRRESPTTAVMVVTSYADVKHAIECLEQGAADYITKPLDGPGLLRRIGRIAARVALRRRTSEHVRVGR
jgi:DNA-binding response OmpR family regulator